MVENQKLACSLKIYSNTTQAVNISEEKKQLLTENKRPALNQLKRHSKI
jgi:hypothetical protein